MSKRAVVLIVLAVVVLGGASLMVLSLLSLRASGEAGMGFPAFGPKVALVELTGTIVDARPVVRQLKQFRQDGSVRAIVLRIESPGGGVAASQEIHDEVRKTRESGKVIVASMGSVAASGGYYVAVPATRIMANPGTTTGSIGVVAELPNIRRLLDKLGIDFTVIKSGKFKDTGSPYRGLTEAERAYLQQWVDDAFAQFVDAVAEGRRMERARVLELADGRVFTGLQALRSGLVDTLGTFEDAIRLAADLAGIKGEPRLVRQERRGLRLIDLLFQNVRQLIEAVDRSPRLSYKMVF
ncbi:MAG: signal peptide peptidase SppA [candidate division KSB1 bacterium]|nr:signal peptide peptidase SppA [candidate division KSB1 bacterium]MDZ7385084.1 signal peptide peptidase SppA [candidate division KSB1 bacterium]MDZ7391657.1 signal peptide peptidase SppA [candidate division KSB1 bacterium]MDZ7413409.1 signal peptide peptidase SppA [candidate division KSB1 bacterium]